jgi:hypothetical protein
MARFYTTFASPESPAAFDEILLIHLSRFFHSIAHLQLFPIAPSAGFIPSSEGGSTMKKPNLLNLAAAGIALFAAAAQAQNPVIYTSTAFDVPFATGSNTKPFAINARGDIVGRYVDSSTGYPRGFLRHSDGTFAPPVDVPVANTGTVLRGIDSRGNVVGKYFDPVPNQSATHGFLLSAGGTFTPFDVNLSAAIAGTTVANGLNNPGQIIGQYSVPTGLPGCSISFPFLHGFLRNTDGSFTAIDFPAANVIETRAQGIDDSGNIVGTYVVAANPPNACDKTLDITTHGFLRDPQGNYTTIDVPASAGATDTSVTGMNDAGDVTGVFVAAQLTAGDLPGDAPIPPETVATDRYFVIWNDGSFTSFAPPYGAGGGPHDLNPRGSLTGNYEDGSGNDHGFLATK